MRSRAWGDHRLPVEPEERAHRHRPEEPDHHHRDVRPRQFEDHDILHLLSVHPLDQWRAADNSLDSRGHHGSPAGAHALFRPRMAEND
jgi:hypothetical protein